MVSLGGFGAGMAGGATVAIVIRAVDNYSKGLKGATTALEKFKKIGIAVAKVYAIGVAGAFLIGVKNAVREEKAVAKLTQQLKNHNQATKENIASLTDLATEMQNVTGFADDQIIAGQAMLASFSLTTKQIKELTPHLLNLATMTENSTGVQADLATTAKMVGVALGGQAGRLVQMGIKINDADKALLKLADDQEKINILMRIFEENAGGLAEAVGNTLPGKVRILQAAFGDLTQSLAEEGGLLDILNSIVDLATTAVGKFNELSPEQKGNIGKIAAGTAIGVGAFAAYKAAQGATPLNPLFVSDVGLTSAVGAGGAVAGGAVLGVGGAAAVGGGGAAMVGGAALIGPAILAVIAGAVSYNVGKGLAESVIENRRTQKNPIISNDPELMLRRVDVMQMSWDEFLSSREQESTQLDLQRIQLNSLISEEKLYNSELLKLSTQFDAGTIDAATYGLAQRNLKLNIEDTRLGFDLLDADLTSFAKTVGRVSDEIVLNTTGMETVAGWLSDGGYVSQSVLDRLEASGWATGNENVIPENDFVSRPGMSPVSFSPQDTIIGVKNPGALGGSSIIVNIENLSGVDADTIAVALHEQLSTMIS